MILHLLILFYFLLISIKSRELLKNKIKLTIIFKNSKWNLYASIHKYQQKKQKELIKKKKEAVFVRFFIVQF